MMITTARALRLAKGELLHIADQIAAFKNGKSRLTAVQAAQLQERAVALWSASTAYEALRDGITTSVVVTSWEDLPTVLIQARIAQRMSQSQVAKKLGVKPQVISLLENKQYKNCGYNRMLAIAKILNVLPFDNPTTVQLQGVPEQEK